jgi:hypothetical protein
LPLFIYLRIFRNIMLRMKHESKRIQLTGGRRGLIYTPLVNITVIISRWRGWEGHVTRVEK